MRRHTPSAASATIFEGLERLATIAHVFIAVRITRKAVECLALTRSAGRLAAGKFADLPTRAAVLRGDCLSLAGRGVDIAVLPAIVTASVCAGVVDARRGAIRHEARLVTLATITQRRDRPFAAAPRIVVAARPARCAAIRDTCACSARK